MLLETVISLGITEEQFMKAVENGLKIDNHKKVFEQLLIVDNFLVFKKLMVKRNSELELEAMKALEQQEASNQNVNQSANARNLERKKLETEQAQLEHAIAMSLAIEEERQKLLEKETNELNQALKLSEMEYKEEGKRREEEGKKKMEEGRRKLEEGRRKEEDERRKRDGQDKKKEEEQQVKKREEEEIKKKEEEERRKEEEGRKREQEEEKKREEERREIDDKLRLTDSQFQKKKGKSGKALEEVKKKKKKVEEDDEEETKEVEDEGKGLEDVEIFKLKNIKPEENILLPPLKQDQKYDPLSLNDVRLYFLTLCQPLFFIFFL